MLNEIKKTKRRVLGLSFFLLVLFALGVPVISYYTHQEQHSEHEKQDGQRITNTYQKILKQHKNFGHSLSDAISQDNLIQSTFKSRNRKRLYTLLKDRWHLLQNESPYLTGLTFYLPDGRTFLRMHNPQKYGDSATLSRPILLKMKQEKKTFEGFGVENDTLNHYTLLPIFNQGDYLGFIALRKNSVYIFNELNASNNIKSALFIHQDHLTAKSTQPLKIDKYLLQYTTIKDIDQLNSLLSHYQFKPVTHKELNLKEDHETYDLYSFDFRGLNDFVYGKVILIYNMSHEHHLINETLKNSFILFGTLIVVIFIITQLGLRKIFIRLRKIVSTELDTQNLRQAIMDHSAYMIIATDPHGTITLFNRSAETRLGFLASDLIGKATFLDFIKEADIKQRAQELTEEFHEAIIPGFGVLTERSRRNLSNHHEWDFVTKSGENIPVHLYMTALRNADDEIEGYLGIAEDITKPKAVQEQLIESLQTLDAAQRIAKIGSWKLEFKEKKLQWSNEIYRIFNLDPKKFDPSYEGYLDAIHPDDRQRVHQTFNDSVTSRTPYFIEHRLKMPDNEIKYVIEQGHTQYNKKGQPLFFMGTIQDVTEKQKIIMEREHYLNLIDKYIITSSTDLEGNITYVSEAFCDISGYSKEELMHQNHNIIRHPDMPKKLYEDLWSTIQADKTWQGEIKNANKSGSGYWVHASISPNFNDKGQKIGYTSIRQDITDKKRVEELAITDRLTGLYNRLKLDEVMEYELKQSQRYNSALSVILIDIDHFKSVNDTYGHQVGDEVLKDLSAIIRNNIRSVDTAGRWGGEEFLLLIPKISPVDTVRLVEKLRKAIEEHTFPVVGQKTASFGVSIYHEGDTHEQIIQRADDALYEAKKTGRNKVMIHLDGKISDHDAVKVSKA